MENPIFEAAERLAGKYGVPSQAVLAACCLVVLARRRGTPELSGTVGGHEVRLPWRATLAEVVREIAGRIGEGDRGVTGLMMESFLVAGSQPLGGALTYGQSVTDRCLSWDTTATLLDELAAAVRARR